jgi:small subunit ribosomal protein S20
LAGKTAPKKNLSTLKRARQAAKRGLHSQSAATRINTYEKKLEGLLPSKNSEEIDRLLRETIKIINSAASKGVIHKNTASRKISRITKKVNAVIAS